MTSLTLQIENIKNGTQVNKSSFKLEKQELSIGRSPESDIPIVEKLSSRLHAKLSIEALNEKDPSQIKAILTDCNSTHGTFVGRKPIESIQIWSGSMVSFGQQDSFYLFNFINKNGEIVNIQIETEVKIQIEDKKINPIKKESGMTEHDYIEKFSEKEKARSRLDIYKELLNKKKGFNFEIQGNSMVKDLQQRSDKYQTKKPKQDTKAMEISWGIVDEEEVNKKHFDDIILNPALLQKIPGLTDKEHKRIKDFENKLNKFRKSQADYNKHFDRINKKSNQPRK